MTGLRLYDDPHAPSPRRVRIFLAEKGLEIPRVTVELRKGEHFTPEFQALNPDCTVPTLVLEDGRTLGDSQAICRYLEALHPEPPLMGRDPFEQAQVEAWSRRIEIDGYQAVAAFLRNTHPAFRDRAVPGVRGGFPQVPEVGPHAQRVLARLLDRLDPQLAAQAFVAGDAFSVADIALLVTLDFAKRMEPTIPSHVQRWYDQVSARPSAQA